MLIKAHWIIHLLLGDNLVLKIKWVFTDWPLVKLNLLWPLWSFSLSKESFSYLWLHIRLSYPISILLTHFAHLVPVNRDRIVPRIWKPIFRVLVIITLLLINWIWFEFTLFRYPFVWNFNPLSVLYRGVWMVWCLI